MLAGEATLAVLLNADEVTAIARSMKRLSVSVAGGQEACSRLREFQA